MSEFCANKMPFPKEWDSKVTVCVYPHKIEDAVVCHNCYCFFNKNLLNSCTGLCVKCTELNFVDSVKKVGTNKCVPCTNRTINMGIIRVGCQKCASSVRQPLRQRCLGCDTYTQDCWNNVCPQCRAGRYLCEKVGCLYSDANCHFRECWCLINKQQVLRYDLKNII